MREIKFRAWDNKKNIFVPQGEIIFSDYGDTRITVNPNCVEYIGDSCHDYTPTGRFIVMQYTGLKDKNGVEIYEGDIVTTSYRDTNGYIYYSAPNFGLKDKIGVCVDFTWEDFNEFEVIGNIYEHSHLISNKWSLSWQD